MVSAWEMVNTAALSRASMNFKLKIEEFGCYTE